MQIVCFYLQLDNTVLNDAGYSDNLTQRSISQALSLNIIFTLCTFCQLETANFFLILKICISSDEVLEIILD